MHEPGHTADVPSTLAAPFGRGGSAGPRLASVLIAPPGASVPGRRRRPDADRDPERALLLIAALAVVGLATALLAVCATVFGIA